MALRLPRLHTLLRTNSRHLQPQQQRRWAQVHDVRFLATHRDPQQILEKYQDKLKQKAKEEGHESIESLKEAYKEKISKHRSSAATVVTPEPVPNLSSKTSIPPSPSPVSQQSPPSPIAAAAKAASGPPGIKPLSSILNIDKILALPAKEIETLWRLRHAHNPHSICAVVPLDTYQRMANVARSNPQFILPLPRQAPASSTEGQQTAEESAAVEGGADIHFLQWAFHPPASPQPSSTSSSSNTVNTHASTIVFTQLASYKLHGSYAQPHTTITHHLDLADDKGLVLMHGQVMPDSGVSVSEASWLVSCVQRFYDYDGEGSGRKGELLRMFTRGDVEGFKVEDLVDETEKIS
ncbi:ATP11 protein-domain-containing protein [Talaromyces proteolyticus]|uniref:ATP11 protein-domain-containing protein n=1 Tax=Talaromyces proteolyticus TaxID=1131652 RepID=A0AAD4L0M0_9EURO|nr:ATP11 protein-domain-containing protein [Talaromyces proteolyticus]KAH8703320.1 ATP11 protein-domain-containing protein [Talaromyces proteolyticus]